ncbi:amidohydrolase family protein [Brevibacterium sp. 50QC2O2]|jgi:cytosine deaminase|uniref:amidohydrolase family protein n=1 Tax=Brevibacterium sp. 50QC2O2 TaxID=2968459 RepID=UPI00211B9FE4|nr:amidohydrolase family protein [Brevibacterium sp. 50QC2O2]MCQ9388137.1 amidohydrolase family protein [Brevibacterium sp. 50QC2O2]
MTDLIIENVRPWGGDPVDITVAAGVVAAVEPSGAVPPEPVDTARLDGGGRMIFPSFSDVHVHLDSTRIGLPFRPNDYERKNLWSSIQNDRDHWRSAEAPVSERATETLGRAIAHGLTRARSYAQIDADCGLERFEGVAAARRAHNVRADVEIVAFPQAGMLLEPGVPALLDEALGAGADIVGGIDPCGLDADPKGQLDTVFDLALKHEARIDIHLHEPGELGLFSAGQIVKRVRALDYKGKVTLAHAFFLGQIDEGQRAAFLEEMRELDMAVTTIAPGSRGDLPLKEIREAGVRMGLGQDGQRDYWSPYGNTDMLDRTWQLSFTNNLRRDADIELALETATLGGARVMDAGLRFGPARGFDVGDAADFVLVPGQYPAEAVMDRPAGRTVVHAGAVVADAGELL